MKKKDTRARVFLDDPITERLITVDSRTSLEEVRALGCSHDLCVQATLPEDAGTDPLRNDAFVNVVRHRFKGVHNSQVDAISESNLQFECSVFELEQLGLALVRIAEVARSKGLIPPPSAK